ncbi:MAG: translation elongation factor Ts [Spirochaetales bacterium]|nr:translation elongation factor Ts [Spirochaetales bacterium]
MTITAVQIRELREKTGAGIMDCKRALERAAGDREKATALLKELGLVQAKKRADREASEGRVFIKTVTGKSVMLKLACETDFVARNIDFIRLGEACLDLFFAAEGADPKDAIADLISAAALKIREKICAPSVQTLTAGPKETLQSYVHGEGRIGVTVRLEAAEPGVFSKPEIRELTSNLALHAAAFAPLFLSRSGIEPRFLETKRAEFTEDARRLHKDESMRDEIVRGKLEKLKTKICFLEQPFIRDEGRTVGEVIAEAARAAGQPLALTGFIYERINQAPHRNSPPAFQA